MGNAYFSLLLFYGLRLAPYFDWIPGTLSFVLPIGKSLVNSHLGILNDWMGFLCLQW